MNTGGPLCTGGNVPARSARVHDKENRKTKNGQPGATGVPGIATPAPVDTQTRHTKNTKDTKDTKDTKADPLQSDQRACGQAREARHET